ELDKAYEASKYEADIYQNWLDSGYFNPDNLGDGEPFSIIMPPPNVTGTLHVGHALFVTIQDILTRFRRMQGRKTLWLPGTDHAAIATQSKVEKILTKEGVRKTDLGREEFVKRVETFAAESRDTIVGQIKALGASVDWSREAYTLDEPRSLAVRTAFKNMYDDGLIYRAHKVINWDPKGQTVISDDEIVHEEREATLYTFKYSADFPISISTTRPETKIGDTAVAVHPEDARYKQFIGQEFDVTFAGEQLHIKIIGEESVDPEFGTGALGVTPAHSQVDAEIGERHKLPFKQVINEFAKMTAGQEGVIDQKTTVAREAIVEWLRSENLLEREESVKQNVATAERSGGIIETLPKLQWFLDVNKPFTLKKSQIEGIDSGTETTLKELMRQVVTSGQIKIFPDHFNKTYFHWIDNLRDWCISRQIWFGHRIPVWYKTTPVILSGAKRNEESDNGSFANAQDDSDAQDDSNMYVGIEAPEGEGWTQDEDTLDTWFSSGLWTFSTLGWPNETPDLKTFHPTTVMETGYDILFFWVARMVLMSGYHLGQIPFEHVYLHGLIRDSKNQKMSKSLGNIIDPLDMIEKYGTDALRFALVFNTAPGTDTALAEDKIKGMKHFGNKLWNITRYILTNISADEVAVILSVAKDLDSSASPQNDKLTKADQLILNQLSETIESVSKSLNVFRIHDAAQTLYEFVWKEFADVYIEATKEQIQNENQKANTQAILLHILLHILKLLHPFMPFVTEVLWQKLREGKLVEDKTLIIANWPK
ncbi:TPA: valine--tRNA ligase, partial [Patescibacteria group bacterium]|nr:valine--tRNA ligase [Patescibacteria group bacterium]